MNPAEPLRRVRSRPPSDGDGEGHGPDYLRVLAHDHAFFSRQLTALGLLAASVAAVHILSIQLVAVALASAAAFASGSGLLRWLAAGRRPRAASDNV